MRHADVTTMKLLPIQRVCAAHQIPCPTIWGWRVMRMMPVSHMCSFGLSTAATWQQEKEHERGGVQAPPG